MKYLLDTNACIEYLNNRKSAVAEQLSHFAAEDVALCSVVKAELYFGAAKCHKPETVRAQLAEFLVCFTSLPFDDTAAKVYGTLRSRLATAGTPIGPYDLQIAAIALSHGLTLVTHNTKEFARVEGLKWEDWEMTL